MKEAKDIKVMIVDDDTFILNMYNTKELFIFFFH